ncbi:hypothetical protein [Flavobacterium urocaniciphilum]|uniref:Lipoprotein n=1 Tax=Flavobacterium urocaniciphilum TaxID=1299341 RepID=A0A1H8YY99_9FLAO|nr:hypothetical protein [Flavobacterium urocaniciphilum]SEP57169.1 hypothetical protein SAMN05444005_101360 [Flavobacterium urocaniciphilum]
MKTINILFLISCITISCHSNQTEKEKKTDLVNTQLITKKDSLKGINKKNKNSSQCLCFDGIGSKKGNEPIHTFEFTNGKKIIVCGYLETESEDITISEFNIFDCETEKPLVEYGATRICKIVKKKDTLQINEYTNLPILKNFEWKLVKIGKQTITTKNNQFIISKIVPDLEKFQIDEVVAEKFLKNLKKGQGFGENWETEICFLEVLSLKGNEKAWNILKNYETFIGQETDGAIAETWKDAVSLVEWVKKYK